MNAPRDRLPLTGSGFVTLGSPSPWSRPVPLFSASMTHVATLGALIPLVHERPPDPTGQDGSYDDANFDDIGLVGNVGRR